MKIETQLAQASKTIAWLVSNDTGLSSKYMASVLSEPRFYATINDPWDIWDFGRCYRLLRAVPEMVENFDRLATCPAPWPALHANWGRLESLYEKALAEPYQYGKNNLAHDAFRAALNKCAGR